MWPYIILIFLPIFLQHINIKSFVFGNYWQKNKEKNTMTIFWILLLLLLVLRHHGIGRDLRTYQRIFNYIAEKDWITALGRSPEIAWSFMNKIIAEIGGGFSLVVIVSAVLSVFWIGRAYIKYSMDTSLTVSLYIILSNFVLMFSGLRQAIAISLGFLAFEYVRKKQLIPFIVVTVIAFLFQTSAFMIIFMYPLYHMKLEKKKLFYIVPALIIIWIFNQQIFSFLGVILNQFTDYDTTISETGSVTMLVLFIIFTVFSYLIPKEAKLDEDTAGMRNFMLLSVALQMFAPLHSLAMRMNYYYIAFIPLLIPRIIKCRSTRWRQIAIMARYVMILFFLVYFFMTAPSDNVLDTFPYKFIWGNG